jgi:hypothetical protein
MKRFALAAALIIGGPATAQTITPQFTQGSYSATTTTTQTITETVAQKVYGSEINTWSGTNVTPSADVAGTGTTFSVTDNTQPWQLEITTRPAGLIETIDTTRTITTNSTTVGLSVFSQ